MAEPPETTSSNPLLLLERLGDWAGDGVASFIPDPRWAQPVHAFVGYLVGIFVLLFVAMLALSFVRFKLGSRWMLRSLGRDDAVGLACGAGLGVFTPVCSCFVTSVYASLLRNGASRRSAAAYLFAAPAVNEIAISLMFAATGWRGALTYVTLGMGAAVLTGRFHASFGLVPNEFIEGTDLDRCLSGRMGWADAGKAALRETAFMFRKLTPYLVLGCAMAGYLEGYSQAPIALLTRIGGTPLAPVVAAVVGLPLDVYAPVAASLIFPLAAAGVPLGTLISLMMAMTLASVPEGIVLHKVIGSRNLAKLTLWYLCYTAGIGLLINLLGSRLLAS